MYGGVMDSTLNWSMGLHVEDDSYIRKTAVTTYY